MSGLPCLEAARAFHLFKIKAEIPGEMYIENF